MQFNESVSLSLEEKVGTLVIDRESSLNALNAEVLQGILDASKHLSSLCSGPKAYETIRCLVIRGAGAKAFVAGADIKLMHSGTFEEVQGFIRLGQAAMSSLEETPLPIIAAVDGFALGGGLELALAADIIVATTTASLGQPEVNLGLIPGFGGTQRLTARVGTGQARRLIYHGGPIDGVEAHRIGLADYLLEPDQFEEHLCKVSRSFAKKAPLAIAAAKRSINNSCSMGLAAGLEAEVEEFLGVFKSEDASAGISAFVSKEKAEFSGK